MKETIELVSETKLVIGGFLLMVIIFLVGVVTGFVLGMLV